MTVKGNFLPLDILSAQRLPLGVKRTSKSAKVVIDTRRGGERHKVLSLSRDFGGTINESVQLV